LNGYFQEIPVARWLTPENRRKRSTDMIIKVEHSTADPIIRVRRIPVEGTRAVGIPAAGMGDIRRW
jgi:hypothetical protein